jgi:hypothetical protein
LLLWRLWCVFHFLPQSSSDIYLIFSCNTQSVFLGLVQFTSISFTTGPDVATMEQKARAIWKAIDFFAFCGISFDVLGTLFALWTYRSLLLTIATIEEIMLKKQNLSAKVYSTIRSFLEAPHSTARQSSHTQQLPENFVDLLTDFQQSWTSHHREAREVVHLINDHIPVQEDDIVLAIIAVGLLFFFVSLFSFIITTQPLSMWVSTTVVVAITFIFLRINVGHQQPGFWRFIMRKLRKVTVERSPLRNMGDRQTRNEV